MATLEELQAKRAALRAQSDETFAQMDAVIAESNRVADVAHDAARTLRNYDAEFERQTKLRGKDIGFVFFATTLQCVRQYLLTNFNLRLGDKEAAKNTLFEKQLDPHNATGDRSHRLYNPSFEEILSHPVPFDANNGSAAFDHALAGYGVLGHRAATLGHDRILGWIFGTANIATSTLTTADFLSYHISSEGKRDYFSHHASTVKVLTTSMDKLLHQGSEGKKIIALSLAKEAVHLASDRNTKHGLPIPVLTSASPELANSLASFAINMPLPAMNVLNVAKQAALAEAINMLIAMIHRLTYNAAEDGDERLFSVRTRRVITTSNVIASTSNILAVAIGTTLGAVTKNPILVKKSLAKLDIGGFLVTLYHLLDDRKFIAQLKEEYVFGRFDKLIQGDTGEA